MENLQQFITIGDSDGVGIIWACCIMSLAHLSALCHSISRTDLVSSTRMNRLYDLTLEKLGNLSSEVHIEDHSHLDVLTGVRSLQLFVPLHELGHSPSQSIFSDVLERGVGHHRRAYWITPRD